MIYMIMGKSATGKDMIYRSLMKEKFAGLEPLVIYTTRPKRAGEKDGREYYFTGIGTLEEMRRAGRVIEERVYHTVHGDWHYFTAESEKTDFEHKNYLIIGTLEAYGAMRKYFGDAMLCPLYIEAGDETRLRRAVDREAGQNEPAFAEVCRRYLADEEDFSEEKLAAAGIRKRFSNDGPPGECAEEIRKAISEGLKENAV